MVAPAALKSAPLAFLAMTETATAFILRGVQPFSIVAVNEKPLALIVVRPVPRAVVTTNTDEG